MTTTTEAEADGTAVVALDPWLGPFTGALKQRYVG